MTGLERRLLERRAMIADISDAITTREDFVPCFRHESRVHENGIWFDEWLVLEDGRKYRCTKDSSAELMLLIGNILLGNAREDID